MVLLFVSEREAVVRSTDGNCRVPFRGSFPKELAGSTNLSASHPPPPVLGVRPCRTFSSNPCSAGSPHCRAQVLQASQWAGHRCYRCCCCHGCVVAAPRAVALILGSSQTRAVYILVGARRGSTVDGGGAECPTSATRLPVAAARAEQRCDEHSFQMAHQRPQ